MLKVLGLCVSCSVVLPSAATLHLSVFINILMMLEPLWEDSFPADRRDVSSLSDASFFSDRLQLWERERDDGEIEL